MFRNPIHLAVFLGGLAVLAWIGTGYVVSNPVALIVTLSIGACYVAGSVELQRHHRATSGLIEAVSDLAEPPPALGAWLERVPASLRHGVRLRIEGTRGALPSPALAPYLVGLLVLLGMLGTLLGMMATLRGTGAALESAADLQAIRASLAAPVKGLGFAFGTSIAGVATSAMLGLLAAFCRRERTQAVELLDEKIATTLRAFSPAHRRDEAFRLLQRQADAMPTLVDRLHAMTIAIEQQNVKSNERQLASQEAFHSKTEAAYLRLASSVEQSLKESIAENARNAGAMLQPVVETTMAGLERESVALRDGIARSVERQLDGLSKGFETSSAAVAQIWDRALDAHRQSNEALVARLSASAQQYVDAAAAQFEQHSASLLQSTSEAHVRLADLLASRDETRLAAWAQRLEAMAAALSQEWERSGARNASRQQEICDALSRTMRETAAQTQAHASETIAEIARLMQAASEAPKLAAEVVAQLRQKLSDSMARDTAMLEERSRMLATLNTLLDAVNDASTRQRSAVDELIATSSGLLERAGQRFTETLGSESDKLGTVVAQMTSSAIEVASLSEAFGAAAQLFGDANEKLVAHLERIEAALDKSLARSDDQLAYYVAQAREVIDLSMMSQKQIVEDLQRLATQRTSESAGAEAA
ncbi:DUF802 domain-containing protein [Paraburkholderia sp. NMBU_R16]|uniref:DUF802 domain-containing protein n=1 Tax=Paraburkholderia sp. NMBU_R16 TaxID=2698676 RepID=UPI001563886A|nr:DUF802 domain-containing protein [Paraburkholderia sp. NMBU_R16]NRO96473.1 DUF802 domain-containing protein [Paraburkholderia sp. NMBU_R16]